MQKREITSGQKVIVTRGRYKGQSFTVDAVLASSGQVIIGGYRLYSLRSVKSA